MVCSEPVAGYTLETVQVGVRNDSVDSALRDAQLRADLSRGQMPANGSHTLSVTANSTILFLVALLICTGAPLPFLRLFATGLPNSCIFSTTSRNWFSLMASKNSGRTETDGSRLGAHAKCHTHMSYYFVTAHASKCNVSYLSYLSQCKSLLSVYILSVRMWDYSTFAVGFVCTYKSYANR